MSTGKPGEEKLDIIGVAVDGNPDKLVSMLLNQAGIAGHSYAFYKTPDMVECFDGAGVIILGINSQNNDKEAALIKRATEAGARVVVVEDIHCAHARLPESCRQYVDLLVAADSFSAKQASKIGYEIGIVPGPPPHWKSDVEMCRSRHYSPEIWVGSERITNADILVWYGGGKNPEENNQILKYIGNSIRMFENPNFVLAMTRHPGESQWAIENGMSMKATVDRQSIYEQLRSGGVRFVDTSNLGTRDLFARVDVPIMASASTMTIGLTYARRPSIFLYSESVRQELLRLGNSSETWYLADFGCMVSAEMGDEGSLQRAIRGVVEHPEPMIQKMEACFPTPAGFDTAQHWWEKISERLEDIATLERECSV